MRPSYRTSDGGCFSLFVRNLLLVTSSQSFKDIFFSWTQIMDLEAFCGWCFLGVIFFSFSSGLFYFFKSPLIRMQFLFPFIWGSQKLSKVIVFSWQLLLYRFSPRENLFKIKVIMHCCFTLCPIYDDFVESTSHLFVPRDLASSILYRFFQLVKVAYSSPQGSYPSL